MMITAVFEILKVFIRGHIVGGGGQWSQAYLGFPTTSKAYFVTNCRSFYSKIHTTFTIWYQAEKKFLLQYCGN